MNLRIFYVIKNFSLFFHSVAIAIATHYLLNVLAYFLWAHIACLLLSLLAFPSFFAPFFLFLTFIQFLLRALHSFAALARFFFLTLLSFRLNRIMQLNLLFEFKLNKARSMTKGTSVMRESIKCVSSMLWYFLVLIPFHNNFLCSRQFEEREELKYGIS